MAWDFYKSISQRYIQIEHNYYQTLLELIENGQNE